MFARLGRWCFRRHWETVGAWIFLLVGMTLISQFVLPAAFDGEFTIPASESSAGFDVIEEHFPDQGGGGQVGNIVFKADQGVNDPAVVAEMTTLFDIVDAIDGVSLTSPYTPYGAGQINQSGAVAYAQVNLDPDIDQTESAEIGREILADVPSIEGVEIEVGGAALAEFEPPESELIGLAFAIVVLIVSFGSVLAMGLPIGVALFGVGTGAGVIALISNLTTMPDFAPTLGAMIGLGVGIDYALFIVTRYREGTRAGLSPEEATVRAMDTAGRAVAFAGITVVVSLLGMLLIGLAFISGLGIGAATVVTVTLAASLTLLPAMLGIAQHRVETTRYRGLIAAALIAVALLGVGLGVRPLLLGAPLAGLVMVAGFIPAIPFLGSEVPKREAKPVRETFSYRWAHLVQDHPIVSLLIGGGILIALAVPVLSLRLGFSDEGNFNEATTTRKAYDLLAEGFGPGFNGPFVVVAELGSPQDLEVVQGLQAALDNDPGVAFVSPPFPNNLDDPAVSDAALIQVIPATAPQDEATSDLVEHLRADVIPAVIDGSTATVHLTGAVPASIDFTSYLAQRIFLFFGVVLTVSFVLLMMVFRSLLVPLKAVVMNMLSIAAAFGVAVMIFQWGWGSALFGVEAAPIEPFVPMMLFAIVFGLSMDYEVFLLSRVKEEYDRSGDPVGSVADGLAATARVITAAAAIMVVVFGSFLFEDNRIIKLFGLGLAVAVFIDASLVRMLLVPATMRLLGAKNWWLPGWLDRILPTLNVEGPSDANEPHGDDDARDPHEGSKQVFVPDELIQPQASKS